MVAALLEAPPAVVSCAHADPVVRLGPARRVDVWDWTLDDYARYGLAGRILAIVCSEWWADHCRSHILNGRTPYHPQESLRGALRDRGVYPPGGKHTRMRRCKGCRRWVPPGCVDARRVCLDCYYGGLTETEGGRERLAMLRASAHRRDRAVRHADLAAHFEGTCYARRSRPLAAVTRATWTDPATGEGKTVNPTCRTLGFDGQVHTFELDEATGEAVAVTYHVPGTPAAAAAAEAQQAQADAPAPEKEG